MNMRLEMCYIYILPSKKEKKQKAEPQTLRTHKCVESQNHAGVGGVLSLI